jgi:hypothetical protein
MLAKLDPGLRRDDERFHDDDQYTVTNENRMGFSPPLSCTAAMRHGGLKPTLFARRVIAREIAGAK